MKSTKFLVALFLISFLIAGCTDQPGPLAINMSRIQVICRGVDLINFSLSIDVADAATDTRLAEAQSLNCIGYGEINFDVVVPPYSFKVRKVTDDGGMEHFNTIETITFTGPGQTQTIRIDAFLVNTKASI